MLSAAAEVAIRALEPDDAPALARCFREGYGESYVTGIFYDEPALRARVAEGRLRSVVAVTPAGEIIGHMGLSLRRPGDVTVDAGNTLVDPAYRNQRLAARLGLALARLCRDAGFLGFHHYPTTAHPAVQKLAVAGGGTETGVLHDYIPASTEYRALEASGAGGPWAAVAVFQPLAPCPPRSVFLPARHRETLVTLYARAGLTRSAEPPRAPAEERSRIESELEARRGLLRAHATCIGADLSDALDALLREAEARVVHLDLPLADPAVEAGVEAARRRGFCFAALLPEYRDGDVLRLQYLPGREGELPHPVVATQEARELLELIAADRE